MTITDLGYIVGVDLGQAQDYTAIAVAHQLEHETVVHTEEEQAEIQQRAATGIYSLPVSRITDRVMHFEVPHLERMPLGTRYPAVVQHVKELMTAPALTRGDRKPSLVVDHTGVGRAVTDLMDAARLNPVPITITGGDSVTYDMGWRVPKRDLVSALQVLLQSGRLKVASALPAAAKLVEELEQFRVKIDPLTAHDSYGSWREGSHDDLVLALACACWYGQRYRRRGVDPKEWAIARIHS